MQILIYYRSSGHSLAAVLILSAKAMVSHVGTAAAEELYRGSLLHLY
jgi:hypothetical protein